MSFNFIHGAHFKVLWVTKKIDLTNRLMSFFSCPIQMRGEKGKQHILLNNSAIIHLQYTEYIFIHSFNKYLLDTHYVLVIIPGLRDTEEKLHNSVKWYFWTIM